MFEITAASPPVTESDKDCRQGQDLSDFDANIEAYNVRNQTLLGQRELLELGCQTETVEQAEYKNGESRVDLKTQKALEAADVFESLVDNGQSDHSVDNVGIRLDPTQDPG